MLSGLLLLSKDSTYFDQTAAGTMSEAGLLVWLPDVAALLALTFLVPDAGWAKWPVLKFYFLAAFKKLSTSCNTLSVLALLGFYCLLTILGVFACELYFFWGRVKLEVAVTRLVLHCFVRGGLCKAWSPSNMLVIWLGAGWLSKKFAVFRLAD